MPTFARQLTLALIILLLWVVAAMAAQSWLRNETNRMLKEAVAVKSAQFDRAIQLLPPDEDKWSPESLHELELVLGIGIDVRDGPAPKTSAQGPIGSFDRNLPDGSDRHLHVAATPSTAIRLTQIQQRLWLITAMVAGLFLMIPVFYVLTNRPQEAASANKPHIDPRVEMRALEHLVRISEDRNSALEREASARKDAEHNLQLSQSLLDQSVEQRSQLGRDLHDDLCQTLYAVALSVEGARKRLRSDPDNAERSLTVCIEELRSANRNVRAYIAGLTSRAIDRKTFKGALESMIESFSTLAGIPLKGSIDEKAAELMDRASSAELLQIVREAVSNSIRHAQAGEISISVQPGDGCVVMEVADDGRGFDPRTKNAEGYGMTNMRARAEILGASLQIHSLPGTGTRVRVELPAKTDDE